MFSRDPTKPLKSTWPAAGFDASGIGVTVSIWGAFAAIGVITGGTLDDHFGSDGVVSRSLILLAASFPMPAAATAASPKAAFVSVLVAIAVWGFSVWAFFPALMSRLISVGALSQASVTLSLNTSTMYFGFSVGSTIGAGILGTGAIRVIGIAAALSELSAPVLDRRDGASR